MFILANLIVAVATILNYALDIYKWLIIIAALISWVRPDPYNPIVRFLYRATEPALRPVRKLIGNALGPIDISPVVVILVIIFTQRFLISSLFELAYKLKGGAAL